MYAYFKGKLAYVGEDSIILDVHDIGYRILLSPASIAFLPQIGEEVRIYTYTSVREDAIWLYGFLNFEDLEIFKKCITVSGIGPKGGMSVLSVYLLQVMGSVPNPIPAEYWYNTFHTVM